jgi:DNA-binding NtrC family response regulator
LGFICGFLFYGVASRFISVFGLFAMKILLAEDEKSIAVTLRDAMRDAGHNVQVVGDGRTALDLLRGEDFDCLVSDIRMPGLDGLALLKAAREIRTDLPIILMTAYGSIDLAVQAMKLGAHDFLAKPFLNEEVLVRLERLEKHIALTAECRRLSAQLKDGQPVGPFIGESRAMREVFSLIEAVAAGDATVLVEGESGTGKELVAEALHYNSPRRNAPLVKLSCAVFPEGLIEDELFGHERGAFTDAREARAGRFERASGGTFFLDDIDDLPPQTQVKFLRVLQERTVERLGGKQPIPVDVRIVGATKVDLTAAVREKRFREDLFYRMNVVTIRVPPLRERLDDIPNLVAHFIRKYGKGREFAVQPETLRAMMAYAWPGNVRELEHAVERAIALAGSERFLNPAHLFRPAPVQEGQRPSAPIGSLDAEVRRAEIAHIRRVLEYTKGHKGEASQILGISRKNLWEKMKQYEIKS